MPLRWMARYGGNVAGFFWNAGTALQFVFGMIALSPREISSAVANVSSSCTFLAFGHRNWGVVLGGVLGTFGTFLAVYPGLMGGESGTIFGFTIFVLFEPFAIFSAPLARRYAHAKNAFLRHTLGHPRRVNGLVFFFFARMPIIYECLTHGRWRLACVFALWSIGDIAFSFSRAEARI